MAGLDDTVEHLRVLVASSNRDLRSRLADALAGDDRIRLVAEAKDGDSVLSCPHPLEAVVVDMAIGGLGILGVVEGLRHRVPPPVVVVVCRVDAPQLRRAMLAEGAADLVVVPGQTDLLAEKVTTLTVTPRQAAMSE